ncbi:hypothetical protein A3K82_03165 [Candidatus Pacearchaeota archaeon RBG_19FT_COMBO_34_9]|nr:MAG: hypothetical protein A3K82_03165 [Candidatus Pacearchaeota archaeon RBG_19FT_COMBO_34_9]OGJ17054.1 MAG: hypothetical protein A3K74_01545 [Candidatus Pacearchaeota archaeon RBG_13_33_26]
MKKRKGITISLSNRWLYFLITLGILAIVSVGVYALTPGTKPNPGHLVSEMAPPSPCTANQFLQFDGTNWVCADTPSGLTKGTALYTIANYCGSTGSFTTASTCTTTNCGSKGCYIGSSWCGECYKRYNCAGTCSLCNSAATCNNNLLGYLVN